MRSRLYGLTLASAVLALAVGAPPSWSDEVSLFTDPAAPLFPDREANPAATMSPSDPADRVNERTRREQERQSPAAKERRARSRNAFRSKGRADAAQIARDSFAEVTERPWRSLTLSKHERIVDFRGQFGAVVKREEEDGGSDSSYVESLLPLRSSVDTGQPELATLDLEDRGSEYVPQNPLVPVAISKDVAEGVSFPGGLTAQAEQSSDPPTVVGDRTFFANVEPDADLIVGPSQLGAQFDWQLRSPASPEEYRLRFNVPDGARLRPEAMTRGVELVGADGKVIAFVNPPLAHDASGEPVSASYEVDGNSVVVKVDHRSQDVQYPIYLDPLVDSFNYVGGVPGGCSAWKQSGWWEAHTGSVVTGEFSCPSRPTALWILANPGPGQGEWHFTAPRRSYLTRVDFAVNHYPNSPYVSKIEEGVWANDPGYHNWEAGNWGHGGSSPGCLGGFLPTTPPNFSSPWLGVVYRDFNEQNNACYRGSPYAGFENNGKSHFFPDASAHPGNEARFHMQVYGATNANAAHLVGANLWLDDSDVPRLTWEQINPHTGWLGPNQPIEHHVTAQDPGLGMKSVTQSVEGAQSSTVNAAACANGRISACPEFETRAATYNTNNIPEGYPTLNVTMTDILGKSSTASTTIKVDRSGPTIATPIGALWDHRNQASDHRNEGIYDAQATLNVSASEGSDASNATKRSGVQSIEILTKPAASADTAFTRASGCATSDGKCLRTNTCTAAPTGQCPYTIPALDWTFNADSVSDGDYDIRVVAKDLIGNTSTTSWTVTVDRRGDVYHAKSYTADPASGGSLVEEQWGKLATQIGRTEDQDSVRTRQTIACPPAISGTQCDQYRLLDRNSATTAGAHDAFSQDTGMSITDPAIPVAADILDLPAVGATPVQTGPLTSALAPWQTAPPAAGGTYAEYDTTAPDDDESGSANLTAKVWVDAKTNMPLKRVELNSSGSVTDTVFFTYQRDRLETTELPSDFFAVPVPASPGFSEDLQHLGNGVLGTVSDAETGTSFTPYYAGPAPVTANGSAWCLASTDVVHFNHFLPPVITTPDPDPEAQPAPPGDKQTMTDANYATLQAGQTCTPGDDRADDPTLEVLSYASASKTAQAWLDAYRSAAQSIALDTSDPDFALAGPVPVIPPATTAYVLPLNDDKTTALVQMNGSTVVLQGKFSKSDVPLLVQRLVPR
jgi:hypothetical protein